jgi:hypothetical protein
LTSVINWRLFAAASAAVADNPVTLPFGRARLLISPVAIGSPAIMTMEMSRVAFFAAWAAGVCTATMTSSGEPTVPALRRSDLYLDISPHNVATLAERLAKRPQRFRAADEKDADAAHFLALLRPRRERPRNHRAAEKRDEIAPV